MKNRNTGFIVGIAIGIAIGAALDNIAIGAGIGAALGVAFAGVGCKKESTTEQVERENQ